MTFIAESNLWCGGLLELDVYEGTLLILLLCSDEKPVRGYNVVSGKANIVHVKV